MAHIVQSIISLFLLFSFQFFFAPVCFGSVHAEEEYSEELLLRPLPDRKVLAHFHFESRAPPSKSNGRHHHLFPKAIAQLVQKYRVKEMELSFTQGRWNYERWGGYDPISSSNAKPPGVELWAVFDVAPDHVDASWKNLTHTLSGLFCSSINFLESSTTYSAPEWGFRPASGNLRYGALPREAVCTENLTPWLKLLPCRDKAGLPTLLDRSNIYNGFYHSLRLHLSSIEFGANGLDSGILLDQTLTVVRQPSSEKTSRTHSLEIRLQPSWSMSSIFGRGVSGRCILSKSTNVYFQLERGLVSELKKLQKDESVFNDKAIDSSWTGIGFQLSVLPDKVRKEVEGSHGKSSSLLYEFTVDKYSDSEPFDLGLTWKVPIVWSCLQAPLHASRFLMGSGNERGGIAITLKSTEVSEGLVQSNSNNDKCQLLVNVLQIVPWYIKVYYHTLEVFVDHQRREISDVIEKMRVSPSTDRVSTGMMELVLKLPCVMRSASLTLEFDKGFLHIDEYPPDANQGFDIPSAIISFPNFQSSINFIGSDLLNSSPPLLSKFKEESPALSYTEVLLVPLATPDFSMPYNVITITCTVFALYFGSLLNVLRRRAGEEEKFLKGKASRKSSQVSQMLAKLFPKLKGKPTETPSTSSSFVSSKLIFKIILVAAIAVGWQYYFG